MLPAKNDQSLCIMTVFKIFVKRKNKTKQTNILYFKFYVTLDFRSYLILANFAEKAHANTCYDHPILLVGLAQSSCRLARNLSWLMIEASSHVVSVQSGKTRL